jgi:predicted N-acetyltransferase YhbS
MTDPISAPSTPVLPTLDPPTLDLAPLGSADLAQIERLDEHAFGPGRFTRTAYRLREGVPPDAGLSFVARIGTFLVGANRMTPIRCGATKALLLGPLTVEPAFQQRGIGEALMERSLAAARAAGHTLVILVGDEPYYARVGFKRVPPGRLAMPGPVDPARLLYCELVPGAFDGVSGSISRETEAQG